MTPVHTIALQNGSLVASPDRLLLGLFSTTNLVGGGAGAAVTKAVTFVESMPANYFVEFDAGQDVVCFATLKTSLGFTININPRLAANTVAAGTVLYKVTG